MRFIKILNHKNTIWYVLLFSFLLRVVLVLTVDPYGNDTIDGFDYHHHAITLLNGSDYPSHGSLPFMRPPLYPIILSVVYYFFPHDSYLTARLVNIVFDVAACFVFYKLILLIWDNRPTATLSSLIYAVNPLFIFFCIRVRVEALFTLLVVCGVYILVKEYKNDFAGLSNVFFAGIILGLACLCRPNALFLVAFIPFWILFIKFRIWKTALKLGFAFALACALVILPWTIRNYTHYNELILISDGFGFNFWISNTEIKYDDLRAKNYQEYVEADNSLWQKAAVVERESANLSIKEKDKHFTDLGMQYIKNNFSAWVWLNVLKFAEFWSPMARMDMQGWKALLTLPFGLLLFGGLFFFVKSFFSKQLDNNILYLILALLLVATLTGVMSWSSVRYRVPLVDAYIIPFVVYWFQKNYIEPKNSE